MNPRRVLNTTYRPPGGQPMVQPADRKPKPDRTPKALPAPSVEPTEPIGSEPSPDRKTPVSTRLVQDEIGKLDRIVARLSGRVEATRSFALRWLVQQFDETTIE